MIEKFLSSVPSLPLVRNMGVIKTGPKNNKVITRMSYAEYASVDDAREALKILKNVPFTVAATTFTIKAGLTKVNASRNWALKEAAKMVKVLEASKSADVAIDWQARCVKIGTEIVFSQLREDLKGSFSGIAGHLHLP